MAETQERKKPFWMDDEVWQKQGLPKLEGNMSESVVKGVPELAWVHVDGVVGAYVEKDGLLLYQFYKKDRKEIFDQAQRELSQIVGNDLEAAARKSGIADQANRALDAHPWWPNFKDVLERVFRDHFRFHPFKIDFYGEVDSWSVVMAELDTPVRWSAEQYAQPITKVASQITS